MPFLDVLLHTARVWRTVEQGPLVDGEREVIQEWSAPFACCLFLPLGTETGTGLGRQVREPTLLYDPVDVLGEVVALRPEEELLLVAPELNVAEGRLAEEEVRWMVNGAAQPFGRPGDDVIGFQVALRALAGVS